MAEKKVQSSFPYIAIVALVAVVAVVILVLNANQSDTSLVVDEEGNIVGEAARSMYRSIASKSSRDTTTDMGKKMPVGFCIVQCNPDGGRLPYCSDCDNGDTCDTSVCKK